MCYKILSLLCFIPVLIIAESNVQADDENLSIEFFCGVIDSYNVYKSRLVRVDPQQNMVINHAGIVNIRNSVFKNCGETLTLSMADNKLSNLTGKRLQGLRDLTVLNFFNNVIEHVENGTFDGLPHLEELELSYNRLHGLDAGVRSGLRELRKLHLSQNPIHLREDGFTGLSKLELLELTGANISTIPYGSFNGLADLRRLDLSGNNLTSISEPRFEMLNQLEELDLSMNRISMISKNTFKELVNLKDLWLNDNRITSLPPFDIFLWIPNLNYLYLHKNPLEFFDVAVFKNMQSVVIEPGFVIDFSETVWKNFANATSTSYQCSRLYSLRESRNIHPKTIGITSENETLPSGVYTENEGSNYFAPYYCVQILFE